MLVLKIAGLTSEIWLKDPTSIERDLVGLDNKSVKKGLDCI
jgi:hypothetical protein